MPFEIMELSRTVTVDAINVLGLLPAVDQPQQAASSDLSLSRPTREFK